mmetsp:Transcript_24760/g.57207  ORF Transcript_24760/g.57207 Transcript_24760/m.57207 type:complete len:257 (+) Transcript_24760:2919-3689(+)
MLVGRRVPVPSRCVVTRCEYHDDARVHRVVDGFLGGVRHHVGDGVTPRVRRDVSGIVRAVHERIFEAVGGVVTKDRADHQTRPRHAIHAACDPRYAQAVVGVGGDGACAVRPVRSVTLQACRVVSVVVAVAVVDVTVVVIVHSVGTIRLARVHPFVDLQVGVVLVDARVDHLHGYARVAGGDAPCLVDPDRVVVGLVTIGIIWVVGRGRARRTPPHAAFDVTIPVVAVVVVARGGSATDGPNSKGSLDVFHHAHGL